MINGEPDGNGKVYDINTGFLIYEGGVKKGIYNGPGKLYQGKYLFEEGEFKDGVIQEGTRYNENGTIYSGSFTNNECIGQGRIVFPNGFYVSGYFVENTEVACEYIVPIPSAKSTTSLAISSIPLDAQNHFSSQGVFITENHRYGYFFYFNGDVFIGEIVNDTPDDGILFKYDITRFIPMVVGRGTVKTRYTKPEMVIEEDYKYFQMVCCCLLELDWRFSSESLDKRCQIVLYPTNKVAIHFFLHANLQLLILQQVQVTTQLLTIITHRSNDREVVPDEDQIEERSQRNQRTSDAILVQVRVIS